jgi:hypothetical protein
MLVYDLICSKGHAFEGWFDDLEDLESQKARGILTCPVCDDSAVRRRPSTFGTVKSRPELPAFKNKMAPDQLMEQFIKRWEDFSEKLAKEFDDVGSDFTDEALKMHYGVSAPRNIRGQSTAEQDQLLKDEGVAVYKMPLITRKGPRSSETKN